jgi:hypothetical protein
MIVHDRPLSILQCDVDSLCGVPLSDDMRVLLGLASDWCNVLSECKVRGVADCASNSYLSVLHSCTRLLLVHPAQLHSECSLPLP